MNDNNWDTRFNGLDFDFDFHICLNSCIGDSQLEHFLKTWTLS